MTLSALIAADVATVLLNTDEVGETVTRYPSGDTGSGADAVGAFFEDAPIRDTSTGEVVVRAGVLVIASTVTTTAKDSWLIRSEVWQVVSVEAAEHGTKNVNVRRDDKTNYRRTDGARLL